MKADWPSGNHPNRKAHNWLTYRTRDQFLRDHGDLVQGRCLDLGCGSACYRPWCLLHADEYIGIDWAPRDGGADVVADLGRPLPLGDRSIDTVLLLSVLEHIPRPAALLGETWRVLRPGGCLLVQVPWQWPVHEAPHDYFRFSPHALAFLLREAGFIHVSVRPQGGFFTTIALKLNYFSTRFIRGPKPLRRVAAGFLMLPWQLNQWLAIALDRLDRSPESDATGFVVCARKAPVDGE